MGKNDGEFSHTVFLQLTSSHSSSYLHIPEIPKDGSKAFKQGKKTYLSACPPNNEVGVHTPTHSHIQFSCFNDLITGVPDMAGSTLNPTDVVSQS